MLQIGGKQVDTLYVGGKLVKQVYVGSRKVYPDEGVIPKQIKDAMVLWYDLKRQGATNESMAENPVLKDLSGNGHDATCYNFAWSGMSGIGWYETNFLSDGWAINITSEFGEVSKESLVINKPTNDKSYIYTNKYTNIHVRVTGITNSYCRLEFGTGSIEESDRSIKVDGDYYIENVAASGTYYGFKLYGDESLSVNVRVELIPQYPHALVSDGVDDYALVKGLPILTDFTVFCKREYLTLDFNTNSTILSKRTEPSGEDGAFQFERFNLNTDGKVSNYSFGSHDSFDLWKDNISYMTKASYNGQTLKTGSKVDSDILLINKLFAQGPFNNPAALYSVILFNISLSEQEIDWVKTNLMN